MTRQPWMSDVFNVPLASQLVIDIYPAALHIFLKKIAKMHHNHLSKPQDILTHLLRDFDTSKGIATRYRVQCRNPHRSECTGLCCPTWAGRPLLLYPSSPDPHSWGSGGPVLGWEAPVSWWPPALEQRKKLSTPVELLCVISSSSTEWSLKDFMIFYFICCRPYISQRAHVQQFNR